MGGLTHPVCRSPHSIDGVFPSLVYKGIVKKLVYTFKYPPYITDLLSQLEALLYEGIIQKEGLHTILQKQPVFVPIPLHKNKLRKRGYNQSALLAKALAKRFALPMIPLLERNKDTKTQVGLSKEERQKNIQNAFRIAPKYSGSIKQYETVILVDDVVTSGSTLKECAKVLKRAGVKQVWAVTLAHGE